MLFASMTIGLASCAPALVASAGITAGFGLAQAQASQFINGEIKAARASSMEQSQAAIRKAMSELQMAIKADRQSSHKAYIMGEAEGGPEIGVKLSTISAVATKFEIRVGILGDQAISRLFMDRVDAHLEKAIVDQDPSNGAQSQVDADED